MTPQTRRAHRMAVPPTRHDYAGTTPRNSQVVIIHRGRASLIFVAAFIGGVIGGLAGSMRW